MEITRTNTILYCRQWSETVAFYRNIFAFLITYQTEWFVEFQLHAQAYLSIADERRATITSAAGQGITLSWQVANVEQMHTDLEQRKIAVSPIRQKWGARLFYLRDPEGHRIELWQPVEE
jgi:catechol 2,3-dioxygenase-like lactoylglutathione lyase family enzyme